jgi:hypothetical protein
MSEQQGQPPSSKGRNPTALAIRSVLLVILVVLLAALLYDRFVAAPRANKAYDAVDALLTAAEQPSMGENTRPVTDVEVKSAIGEPGHPREDAGQFAIDRYSWRRGLLFTSYDLYVVFHKDAGGQLVLYQIYKNERPAAADLELE